MSRATGANKALTPAQRDIVLAHDARLLVGAGAGSGKTSTVVQKLSYLLGGRVTDEEGTSYVHPMPLALDQIAAITFTNEAAADLKRKLRDAIGSERRDRGSAIEIGASVHQVLDRYNFELNDIDELVSQVIENRSSESGTADEERGQSYRREVRALVERAIGSPSRVRSTW